MAKWAHDDVEDGTLNIIKNAATRLCVCNAQPTTYTEAITTFKLAIHTIAAADFTGPADDGVAGRKLTVNEQAAFAVDSTDTATHIALADSATSKLLLVTTCTSQVLTAGNTVTVPAWDIKIADPV